MINYCNITDTQLAFPVLDWISTFLPKVYPIITYQEQSTTVSINLTHNRSKRTCRLIGKQMGVIFPRLQQLTQRARYVFSTARLLILTGISYTLRWTCDFKFGRVPGSGNQYKVYHIAIRYYLILDSIPWVIVLLTGWNICYLKT